MNADPGLGDVAALIRAVGCLRPAGTAGEAIAGVLGFVDDDADPTTPSVAAAERSRVPATPRPRPQPAVLPQPGGRAGPTEAHSSTADPLDPLISSLRPLRRAPRSHSLHPTIRVPAPLPPVRPESTPPAAPPSLLKPEWEARIMIGLASTDAVGRVPDLPRAVARLAALQALPRLPMLAHRHLDDTVHVLLDAGSGMQPFLADLQHLKNRLHRVVGGWRVDVRFFSGTPARGAGRGARREWQPYLPPAYRATVIIVSDFGASGLFVSGSAGAAEWLTQLSSLTSAGHRVVGLTPYAVSYIPQEIRRAVPILSWSQWTSVRDAVRPAPNGAT